MDVTIERGGGVVYAAIAGRIDNTTAPSFEDVLGRAIEDTDRGLILDMDALTHINSTGLRVILLSFKHLHTRNAVMVLCSLPEPVRRLFKISGFDRFIEIVESRGEAQEMVRRKGNGGEARALGPG